MKRIFLLFVISCLANSMNGQYMDRVLLGNAADEQSHGFTTFCPDYVATISSGLLSQPGRSCLMFPDNPYAGIYAGIYGGEYQFVLKVNGNRQNYLTVKFSGSDNVSEESNYLAEINNKVLSDIYGSIVTYYTSSISTGSFLYRTYSIPRVETDGKTEVVVKIRSKGRYYNYGTPWSFSTYQFPLRNNMPPLYACYTHSNPSFAIPADETQGVTVSYSNASAATNEKDPTKAKVIVTNQISTALAGYLSSTSYDVNSGWKAALLAQAYFMPVYTNCYNNSSIVKKVISIMDQSVKNHNSGKVTADSEWGGALGFQGYALYLLRNKIPDDSLNIYPNLGGGVSKTRRQQWIDVLKLSFDHGALDRRAITNQVFWAARATYAASFGLYALDSVTYKNYPKIGHQFAREAEGLEYYTGPLTNFDPANLQLGDYKSTSGVNGSYYYSITSKGGSKELPGWVGVCCYGHLSTFMVDLWQMSRNNPYYRATGGDIELLQKAAEHERLQSSMTIPWVDSNGYRVMLGETVICGRNVSEPGKAYYGDPYVGGMLGDKELIGHVRQMLEDGQYSWGGFNYEHTVADLLIPQSLDSLAKYPTYTSKLPLTPGNTDFINSDPEDGILVFRRNGEVVLMNFFISMAHHITSSYSKGIKFTPDYVKFFPSGQTEITKTEPYNSMHHVYMPDRPLLAGGGVTIQLPSYNHSANYIDRRALYDFYQIWYGNYLIGMNTGIYDSSAYDIQVPPELQGKTVYNLTTKENVILGTILPVPAKTVYVLDVGVRSESTDEDTITPGDNTVLKARADELTVFAHAVADSITLSSLKVLGMYPHDKYNVFMRELTFANYAAQSKAMSQLRLDSSLVKLNEAYAALKNAKFVGLHSLLPGKVDFFNRLEEGGRFSLSSTDSVFKEVYGGAFWVFPVKATRAGYYTFVVKMATKRSATIGTKVNVTLFDERGYYADSSMIASNTRTLVTNTAWDDYLEYTWDVYLGEGQSKLLKLNVSAVSNTLAVAQIKSISAEYKDFESSDNAWLFQVPTSNPTLYNQFERQFAKQDSVSPWDFKAYSVSSGTYTSWAKFDSGAPKTSGVLSYYNKDEWLFITKGGYVHPLTTTSPAIVFTAIKDGIYRVNTTVQRQTNKNYNYMYTRYRFAQGGIKDNETVIPKDSCMYYDAYGYPNNNIPVSREFYVNLKKGDAITFEEDAYTANAIGSAGTTWQELIVSKVPDERASSTVQINAASYYNPYKSTSSIERYPQDPGVDVVAIPVKHGIKLTSTRNTSVTIYNLSGQVVTTVGLTSEWLYLYTLPGFYIVRDNQSRISSKVLVP